MKNSPFALFAALLPLAAAGPAFSAASEWEKVEGAAVRIVLSANPGDDGGMRGALQIDLRPGWKTYWLDPGDAGVPPSVTVSANGHPIEAEIGFPPPGRHDDGYAVWAGYDHPVSFALTMPVTAPASGSVKFSVFLGVCETICIPVQSTFAVEPDRNIANAEHEAIVEGAFAALPEEPRPGLRILAARLDDQGLTVETEAPAGVAAELFLASTVERMFGTPVPYAQGERISFSVPVLTGGAGGGIEETRYTLISGDQAVSGVVMVGE